MRLCRLHALAWIAIVATSSESALIADDVVSERPTFYRDILPIVQENCQVCHRHGGDVVGGFVAPMSFMNYKEVRPWAKSIAQAVRTRKMPPWSATELTSGVFENERTLTQTEIDTIVRWVSSRAPAGNPADAPLPKEFPDLGGWTIGEPDLIVYSEPYYVEDEVDDIQPSAKIVITKEMLPEPRWLAGIQYQPDSGMVHHITGNVDAPAIEGHPQESYWIGSIAPGEDPMYYPPGYGNLLRAGCVLNLNFHYHKEAGPGTGAWDTTAIGFKFHPKEAGEQKKVDWHRIVNMDFEIPPGHPNWEVGAARLFEKDALLVTLHPHMHYRGKDMTYTAVYPDGSREVLLEVAKWDFDWQMNYVYNEPKFLPAGSLIDVTAHFENTPARAAIAPEPIVVDEPIRWGRPTTAEMMNAHVSWIDLEPEEAANFKPGQGAKGFR